MKRFWLTILFVLVACGESEETPAETLNPPPDSTVTYSDEREACADRNPLRNLYWGDLHVHTALSFDAYVHQTRLMPADAYRFARGQSVLLPPLNESGEGTVERKLERPLDFAAVTDHAEFLAEVNLCISADSPVFDSEFCQTFRGGGEGAITAMGIALASPTPSHSDEVCGGVDCAMVSKGVWQKSVAAAEAAYDRSEQCSFTSFAAYEYSGATNVNNLHRNVIFRNNKLPELPISYMEAPTPQGLWQALKAECLDAGIGCDVLAIPHNPNWSAGTMFKVEYPGAATVAEEAAQAAYRARIEPLVEVFQHKGSSECRNGFEQVVGAPDELCDFEQLWPVGKTDCLDGTGTGAIIGFGCVSRLDFVREALKEGLREEQRIGANPYKWGLIAATDTHSGTPGDVDDERWRGALGVDDDDPLEQLRTAAALGGSITSNPGGLMAVWSIENSRDALFDAMLRKEVYATSSPRIMLRFFGGWSLDGDLCSKSDFVARGYSQGVSMGADLSAPPDAAAKPTFAMLSARDAQSLPLQRMQIIKGWVTEDGQLREQVLDVAGSKDNGATVDVNTCETQGGGAETLCGQWTDDDFDPLQRAFYYVRVVENPRCRHSTRICNSLPKEERPDSCENSHVKKTIQERAWSSPIWYSPAP